MPAGPAPTITRSYEWVFATVGLSSSSKVEHVAVEFSYPIDKSAPAPSSSATLTRAAPTVDDQEATGHELCVYEIADGVDDVARLA